MYPPTFIAKLFNLFDKDMYGYIIHNGYINRQASLLDIDQDNQDQVDELQLAIRASRRWCRQFETFVMDFWYVIQPRLAFYAADPDCINIGFFDLWRNIPYNQYDSVVNLD